MSERRELSRRDMLKIAGVAALGSALGTASVGGGLLYLSRSEPQPAGPAPAKPEYTPPPPAPIAKAEPAPIRVIERPGIASIYTETSKNCHSAAGPIEVAAQGISCVMEKTPSFLWLFLGLGAAVIIPSLMQKEDECPGDCESPWHHR